MITRYTLLRPEEFRRRLAEAPIAYLPLGTLEWHGEHLPLGSDGLQSQGFFDHLAAEVGGIVMPMLFLGPDRRVEQEDGSVLYGMDIGHWAQEDAYPSQQLAGSAYWVSDDMFLALLDAVLDQLARAGFRIVVAHGHGPSTGFFRDRIPQWRERYGLDCYVCWAEDSIGDELGLMVDHAAANETSLMMALHPDRVDMQSLPDDPGEWPLAIGGRDPRVHASADVGKRAISKNVQRMAAILGQALAALDS